MIINVQFLYFFVRFQVYKFWNCSIQFITALIILVLRLKMKFCGAKLSSSFENDMMQSYWIWLVFTSQLHNNYPLLQWSHFHIDKNRFSVHFDQIIVSKLSRQIQIGIIRNYRAALDDIVLHINTIRFFPCTHILSFTLMKQWKLIHKFTKS